MISWEYIEIFKNIYFENSCKQLLLYIVSKLEKWEINDDSQKRWPCLWNIQKQPFRGSQKDTTPRYFFKFQENVFCKVRHHLKGLKRLWMATSVNSDNKIRYCFSITTDPLNPIGCSFEKMRSQKASLIKKKIWLIERKMFYRKR